MSAEHQRRYKERHPEAVREAGRRYRLAHRDAIRERRRASYRHRKTAGTLKVNAGPPTAPVAHAAQARVYNAIKAGRLVRPTICPECGKEEFIEAAHENYTDSLAIQWLCRPCHRQWDKEHPKGGCAR